MTAPAPGVLYIIGLAHSGSTLLTMMLGGHPRICGVGEVEKLLLPASRRARLADPVRGTCSCGKRLVDCPLWSHVFSRVEDGASYGRNYGLFLEAAADFLGPGMMVCDSSKDLDRLTVIERDRSREGLPPLDIRVIHAIKDVRSYTASWKALKQLGRIGVLRCYRSWFRKNRQIERAIQTSGYTAGRVSYEELCFDPDSTLRAVCAALGIEFSQAMVNLRAGKGHVGGGNEMRLDPLKSTRVSYDFRWFNDPWISTYYHLRPDIARYNQSRVYGNLGDRYRPPPKRG